VVSEVVVRTIIGPAGDTEELSVGLSKTVSSVAVSDRDPGVSRIAGRSPGVLSEEWCIAVSSNLVLELVY